MLLEDEIVVLPSECDGIDAFAGSAIDLTDPDDHVTLGRLAGNTSSFSFTAWVHPVGMQPPFSAILCTDADDGVSQEIGMQFVNEKNELGYLWKDGRWWWNSRLTVQPDSWSHVALCVDSSGATVYVNGIGSSDKLKLPPQQLNQLVMKLGTYHYWSSRNFNGYIDEVCFYNRTLSQDDVRRGMHLVKQPSDTGLVAYYQCNESIPSVLFDRIRGRDGVLESGATRRTSGALVGAGASALSSTRANQPRVVFSDIGCELDVTNTADDEQILVTRLETSPTKLPSDRSVIPNRSWVVDAFTLDNRNQEVTSLRVSADRLIDSSDAAGRMYSFLTRSGWSTTGEWTVSRSNGATSYAATTASLYNTFTRGVIIPHQFAISASGGPVGVDAEDARESRLHIAPQPATGIVVLTSESPLGNVEIVDQFGRVVKAIATLRSTLRVELDDLNAGWYLVRAGSRSIPLCVVR
jgi:hypothetical protein